MDIATKHAVIDTIRFAAWCLALVALVYMPSTIIELWREREYISVAMMVTVVVAITSGAIIISL